MEKNTLIAIVLSLLVLITFQYFFAPTPPQAPPASEQAEKPDLPPREEQGEVPAAKEIPVPVTPSAIEKTVTVETELYKATFSSRGGTVKSWTLKQYTDDEGLGVNLLRPGGPYRALALGLGNDFSLTEADFAISGGDLFLDESRPTGSVTFSYAGPAYSIKRTYTFHHDSYRFEVEDELKGLPQYQVTLGADFGIFDREVKYGHLGPVVLKDVDRVEIKTKKLTEPKLYTGDLKWIALEDKYFFSSIVPLSPADSVKVWKYQDSAAISLSSTPGVNKLVVYAGPKELDRLKGLDIGLEHIVDFGFFSIIARPIFWLLKQFHSIVGNWGWAIVILTIVIRIPFIPLVNKGQRSMRKMQEIQPKMQEIKEKYKNDPKRLQQETMELYKKYKVNPVGGCLPMLLQIPVFFALYKVLLVTIELRQAPWALWITDLSLKDPFYILPIVMGITMVIQQKMTPTAGDPKQQKMMMFMPVVFTFLFLNFASGLVLYWLVNNLLSIAQQFYVNRQKAA